MKGFGVRHLCALAVMLALASVALSPVPATRAALSGRTSNAATLSSGSLSAPTALGVSIGTGGGTAVTLGWTATATPWATGERVYRRLTTTGAFVKVAEFANLTTVTYADDPGTSDVYYVVRSYYTNANGGNWESRDSNQVKPPAHAAAIAIVNTLVPMKPDTGDQLVLTFSERMEPSSFGLCATGGNSGTDLALNATTPNTIVAGGENLTIGTIDLGATGYFTIGGTALNSTCTLNGAGTVLTITLGTVLNGGVVTVPHTATYRPDLPAMPTLRLTTFLGEPLDLAVHPTTTGVLF